MRFVKRDYPSYFPAPVDEPLEIRENVVKDSGSTHVVFSKISSKDLSAKVLDPRVFTLSNLIKNNEIISPGDVSKLLNTTDPEDIERLSGHISERAFNYIRMNNPNYNPEKNILEKEVVEETK